MNKHAGHVFALAIIVSCAAVDLHAQEAEFVPGTPQRIASPVPVPAPVIPSGIIPAQCKALMGSDEILDCYLKDPSNQYIAMSITWEFPVAGQKQLTMWAGWPATAKADLRVAFHNTVAWYNSGMTNYPGTLVADPPPNPAASQYMHGNIPRPVLDGPTAAYPLYLGNVALNLATEIYGWVPWGLHNWDVPVLARMMSMYMMFQSCDAYYPGSYCPVQYVTPGNAISALKFLKTNYLIGATKADTIARVLDWSRKNLSHYNGPFTPENQYFNWQYEGYPPVSRVFAGTPDINPNAYVPTPHHWTAGCYGTSAFITWILKSVNIPVMPVGAGGHTTLAFLSEKLYLSHGDDPYSQTALTNYPASLLLINEATFNAWFPANDPVAANLNVGRRVTELALQYPFSDWITTRYCDDLMKGKDHASSRVYNETFNPAQLQGSGQTVMTFGFSLAYAEASGLWTKLDAAPLCPY